jgi:hypothetical protein
VAIKKLKNTQKIMPRKLKLIANNSPPSFAIFLIEEAITLNGNPLAMGCINPGK